MTTQDRIRREEHRDKIITLTLAGLLLALYAMEAQGAPPPWFAWEYSEDHVRNEQNVGAWESFRAIDDNYGVKAIVSPGRVEVSCYVHYYTADHTSRGYAPSKGSYQLVHLYDALPQALIRCRRAVERTLKISSVGVYNPDTGKADKSQKMLSFVAATNREPQVTPPTNEVAQFIQEECERVILFLEHSGADMGDISKERCVETETMAFTFLRDYFERFSQLIFNCTVQERAERDRIFAMVPAPKPEWAEAWRNAMGYSGVMQCLTKARQQQAVAATQ